MPTPAGVRHLLGHCWERFVALLSDVFGRRYGETPSIWVAAESGVFVAGHLRGFVHGGLTHACAFKTFARPERVWAGAAPRYRVVCAGLIGLGLCVFNERLPDRMLRGSLQRTRHRR
jgi:hypothetical protein